MITSLSDSFARYPKDCICRMYRLHYSLTLKGLLSKFLMQHFCPLYLRAKECPVVLGYSVVSGASSPFSLRSSSKPDHRIANKVVSLTPFILGTGDWGGGGLESVGLFVLFFNYTNQERTFCLFPNISSSHSLLLQKGKCSCISNCEI